MARRRWPRSSWRRAGVAIPKDRQSTRAEVLARTALRVGSWAFGSKGTVSPQSGRLCLLRNRRGFRPDPGTCGLSEKMPGR